MLPWYWWLTLGILVGWLTEWIIDVVFWRARRRRPLASHIEELEGSLDECHRRVAHLRGEIEQRELRIADLDPTISASGDLGISVRTTHVPLSAAPAPTAAPSIAPLDVTEAEPDSVQSGEAEPPADAVAAQPTPPDELRTEETTAIEEPEPLVEEASAETEETTPEAEVLASAVEDATTGMEESEPEPEEPEEEEAPRTDEPDPKAYAGPSVVDDVIVADDEPDPEPEEIILQPDEATLELEGRPPVSDQAAPVAEQLQLPQPAVRPPPPVVTTSSAPRRGDDLTLIRGIGPKLAEALAAAGMTSYADLAQADEGELQSIIHAPDWRRLSYGDWIDQAKVLSAAPPPRTKDDLMLIDGIGPKYAQLLREAGIATFAQLASCDEQHLHAVIDAPPWQRVDYAMWIKQAGLIQADDREGLTALQQRLHRRESDSLTPVTGKKHRSVEALEEADITGFTEPSSTEEATAAAVFEHASPSDSGFAGRREDQQLRAEGEQAPRGTTPEPTVPLSSARIPAQDLAAIQGIGSVFQHKFYEGGIGTYAQLSGLSGTEIRAIIQPEEWQDFDYESWIRQARRLAEETHTMGAVWNGVIPDDLSRIAGIGEVIEQKLYEAGILSYADLATASAGQLRNIVQPEEWQQLDFEGWIAQARSLAS